MRIRKMIEAVIIILVHGKPWHHQADGAERQDPGVRDEVHEGVVVVVVPVQGVEVGHVREVHVAQRRRGGEVDGDGLTPVGGAQDDVAVQGERLERGRGDPELAHGPAAQELQRPQPLAGDAHRGEEGAAPQAQGLERAAGGEHAPERLVGDVGVAEGKGAEAGETGGRGERDGAEAEPA